MDYSSYPLTIHQLAEIVYLAAHSSRILTGFTGMAAALNLNLIYDYLSVFEIIQIGSEKQNTTLFKSYKNYRLMEFKSNALTFVQQGPESTIIVIVLGR